MYDRAEAVPFGMASVLKLPFLSYVANTERA
jgi:hypothetical protein